MTGKKGPQVEELQQEEIVRRYAVQLRETACGGRVRPGEPSARRCYELLNQCAMELAGLTHGGHQRPAATN
jgi:hypothetical protein